MLHHRTSVEQNVHREGEMMIFEDEGGNVPDVRGIKDKPEGEVRREVNEGGIAQTEDSQRVDGVEKETHEIKDTTELEPSKEDWHEMSKNLLCNSEEDDYGNIIAKYGSPRVGLRQFEKFKISEKIRHRLSRMSTYFGLSYDESQKMQKEQKHIGSVFNKTQNIISHAQRQQIGLTDNWNGIRMREANFNEQIQQRDLKPRTMAVDLHFKENNAKDDVHLQKQQNYFVENVSERVFDDTTPRESVENRGEVEDRFEQDTVRSDHTLERLDSTVNLTAPYLDQQPRIFDAGDILDYQYIPWDQFPNISRLRAFSKKHFDRGDGERFTADELDLVEGLLSKVREDITYSQHPIGPQAKQITQLGRMKRLCLILDLIEQREPLKDFIRCDIDDDALPLPFARFKDILKHRKDASRVAEQFCTEQFRAVSRDWGNGAHHVMHRLEALPSRPLRAIGFGSQGSIDEVQLSNSKGSCARKKWIAGANLKRITARFDDEVRIIKKVAAHPHILELLASYTRGREFGLLLPLADCDLWQILTMNPSERKDAISNDILLQSLGCLSSGLCFMHDKGIKHKDIKPQNIVLRQGGFQFTDFGLSKDISDLSHSTTDGTDRGTFKYMAPEVTKYQPQGRAADVFSLACVLFEIFSVWRGFSVDDADSFSALAPFHMNLSAIHSWIGGELAPITPLSLLRYKNSQSIFGSMFTHNPVDRPQIREVVFKMTMVSYPRDLFCNRCLGVVLRRSEAP